MRRRGRLVAVVAAAFATGCVVWAIPALAGTTHTFVGGPGVAARAPVGGAGGPARLQVFYSPPVLVRAGERVVIPVDAACLTGSGTTCKAWVRLSANAGGRWTHASAAASAFLRFDVSAPAARAVAAEPRSASVSFTISASTAGLTTSLGTKASPLRFFIVRHMPRVRVPAIRFAGGTQARGTTALYLPWGVGPRAAAIAVGAESPTLGPSSFAVGPGGVIELLDSLQGRLASFRDGRLLRSVRLGPVSPDADVAVSADGNAFVSSSNGGAADRELTVRTIAPGSPVSGPPAIAGHGIPERLDAATGGPAVLSLPEDEWRAPASAGAAPSVGRPLADGSELLSIARGRTVRLGTVVGGVVIDAVELSFDADLGELALADRTRDGGYVVVVHVSRGGAAPADQYQVVRVLGNRVVSTFGVPRLDYAHCDPLSRFRLGPEGVLYELASSADGMRVVRFGIGGEA